MITFWNASGGAQISSLRNNPEQSSKKIFFLLVRIEAEVTNVTARRQLIIRRTLIPSCVKFLDESPYRPVATLKNVRV